MRALAQFNSAKTRNWHQHSAPQLPFKCERGNSQNNCKQFCDNLDSLNTYQAFNQQ